MTEYRHYLILPKLKSSDAAHTFLQSRNIYRIASAVGVVVIAFSLVVGIFPMQVGAFWPFSNAVADTVSANTTLIQTNNTGLLRAQISLNPHVSAGAVIAMTNGSALIAESGPIAAVSASSQSTDGQISLYVVRQGDSLSDIAKMFGVSVNTILWANNIRNRNIIKPGITLLILPISGLQHTITKGETLSSIAKKYHANANDIALYNGLGTSAFLAVGNTILIPGGEMSMPSRTSRTHYSYRRSRMRHRIVRAPVNPYRGGSGPELRGFFNDPLPGGIITQTLHGWNAFDIGARRGTPIHAAAGGTVIVSRVGGWNGGYGNYVVIDHGNSTQTLYAHMSRDISRVGEQVSKSQIIGYVGMTGEATGPHLHFEVRGAKNPFFACGLMEVDTRCFSK